MAGDQLASWGHAGLMGLGLTLAQIPMIAVPLSAAWLGLSIWLGRTHHVQEQQAIHPFTDSEGQHP